MRDSKNILKCLVLNCQSICNKCTQVMECATDRDADIMFLSETWLRSRKKIMSQLKWMNMGILCIIQ